MGGGTEKPLEVVFAGDALGTAMRVVEGMPRFGNGWFPQRAPHRRSSSGHFGVDDLLSSATGKPSVPLTHSALALTAA